jgi:hypothetical protein
MGTGFIQVSVTSGGGALPIENATVIVSRSGVEIGRAPTDEDGNTETLDLGAPDRDVTLEPEYAGDYYSSCDVDIIAEGFPVKKYQNVKIFDTITTQLLVNLTPEPALDDEFIESGTRDTSELEEPDNIVTLPEHPLVTGAQRHAEFTEPPANRILPEVVIPRTIIVHLGRKEQKATNVTVTFRNYIKNVCSHEIFPTWPERAIRANIHCQVSLALNRIYTEFYPSQGYAFDITSSTWTDQNYVHQGEVFPNISAIVDDIFNVYARRVGHKDPYYTDVWNIRVYTISRGTCELLPQSFVPFLGLL